MNFEEYEELIPPAHRYPRREGAERSRFADFVKVCLKQGIDFADLLDGSLTDFDLDKATGKQLDYIGAIVGADRKLPFVVEGSDGLLEDEDYRLLIRARIATNTWDGTNESLANILRTVFGNYGFSFVDMGVNANQDPMHMVYRVRGNFSDIQTHMFEGDLIVPRPAGVKVRVDFIGVLSETRIATNTVLGSDFARIGLVEPVTDETDSAET